MDTMNWQFDEFRQVGRDYGLESEVEVYDETHSRFRDMVGESEAALDLLELEPGMRLLDIGCGTGTFAAQAAKRGLSVDAADVSETMLDAAGRKCDALGVRFHHAGFLTLELEETSIDAITTTFAFHHLPDFWKGIALNRISKFLKEGGVFYLRDVILESRDPLDKIGEFISEQDSLGGDFLRIDAEGHFRDEHSTYDWVMDGLLNRSGFSVTSRTFEQGVLGTYVCRKVE